MSEVRRRAADRRAGPGPAPPLRAAPGGPRPHAGCELRHPRVPQRRRAPMRGRRHRRATVTGVIARSPHAMACGWMTRAANVVHQRGRSAPQTTPERRRAYQEDVRPCARRSAARDCARSVRESTFIRRSSHHEPAALVVRRAARARGHRGPRLLRVGARGVPPAAQPDIQGDRIVFVYAGDLWTVARAGGTAPRLTTHEGIESFPKFSPDGQTIAFTGEYDGNIDAFTVPGQRRRADAAHLAPRRRRGRRVVPGRQVAADPLGARVVDAALHALLQGAGRRAASRSCCRCPPPATPASRADGKQIAFVSPTLRQPHLEALQGRQRAQHLDLRLREEHLREDHGLGRARRVADVPRPHGLLLLATAAAAPPTCGRTTSTRRRTARSRSSPTTT